MRKIKSYFFLAGGKKFLNGDKPDQDTFEDLTDSVTFPKEVNDRAKVSEAGLSKTTIDTKVNAGDDTDQAGISPTGFTTFVKPSQLWRLTTADSQVTLTPVTRDPLAAADSENGDLIQDIEISINPTMPTITVTDADNGLSLTGTIVELGGTLTKTTSIDAAGWGLNITDIDSFNSTGDFLQFIYTETMQIEAGQVLILKGSVQLKVQTPNVVAATATPGQVLTLMNADGTSEWQDVSLVGSDNIYTTSGTLLGNRAIDAGGFSVGFDNGSQFEVTSFTSSTIETTTHTIDTTNTEIIAATSLKINAPNTAVSSAGYVLKLNNPLNGDCEWTDVSSAITDTSIYNTSGALTGDRNIDGGALYSVSFNNNTTWQVSNSGAINLDATGNIEITATANLVLQGDANLKLVPSNNASATNGDIPVRIDATGTVEYQPQSYVTVVNPVTSIPLYGITNGEIISVAVHGKGTQPSVEVWEDVSGGSGTQWDQVYVSAAGVLRQLIVNSAGDVIIEADTNARIFRIIIKQ